MKENRKLLREVLKDIRRKYGVNILGVKRENKTDVNISPETVLDADMTLLVLGENQKLKKHFRL